MFYVTGTYPNLYATTLLCDLILSKTIRKSFVPLQQRQLQIETDE